MEDLRVGSRVRAQRHRLALRQLDVATLAGVSDKTVSRIEHGRLSDVTVGKVRAVARVLEIEVSLALRSHGGAELDRQIDFRHAAIVEAVIRYLGENGWQAYPEWSFNHFGDRGSVDVLAWHPARRALLLIEVKSEIRDLQDALSALDVKRRVVPELVRPARGWDFASIGLVLAIADLRTERVRVERHRATFAAALPARTIQVKRWLREPVGHLRGIWFLQIPRAMSLTHRSTARSRVRRSRDAPGMPFRPMETARHAPTGANQARLQRGEVVGAPGRCISDTSGGKCRNGPSGFPATTLHERNR